MLVSEEVWKTETQAIAKLIQILVRARRVIAAAAAAQVDDYWALPLIVERVELLRRGELSPHLTKWLSSHVTQLWNVLCRKRTDKAE